MTTVQRMTSVNGVEQVKKTQVKRTKTFLLFFKTEWWETVKATSMGNDIHVHSDRKIDNIYLNGIKVNK